MFNPFRFLKFLSLGAMPESTALDEAMAKWDESKHPRGGVENKGRFTQTFEHFSEVDDLRNMREISKTPWFKDTYRHAIERRETPSLKAASRNRFKTNLTEWTKRYRASSGFLMDNVVRLFQGVIRPMEITVPFPGRPISLRFPHGDGTKGTGITYGLLNHLAEGGVGYTGFFTLQELGKALHAMESGRGVMPLDWNYKGQDQAKILVSITDCGDKPLSMFFIRDKTGNIINIFSDRPGARRYFDEDGNATTVNVQDEVLRKVQAAMERKKMSRHL